MLRTECYHRRSIEMSNQKETHESFTGLADAMRALGNAGRMSQKDFEDLNYSMQRMADARKPKTPREVVKAREKTIVNRIRFHNANKAAK